MRPGLLGVQHQAVSRVRLSAIVFSLGLHAALLMALLWLSHHARAPADALEREGAVELIMVEHQGAGPDTAPPQPAPPAASPAPAPQPDLPPQPPPPTADTADEALPLPPSPAPPPTEPPSVPSQAEPPLQRAQEAPQINLGGDEDETDAVVLGPHVIPASLDDKFRNREPAYPPDAARRAEQGAVILLIHVSPQGLPAGVDIEQSSGYASLDRAARDAVTTWHFLPAVKDGQPIAFDMAFRVVFHLN